MLGQESAIHCFIQLLSNGDIKMFIEFNTKQIFWFHKFCHTLESHFRILSSFESFILVSALTRPSPPCSLAWLRLLCSALGNPMPWYLHFTRGFACKPADWIYRNQGICMSLVYISTYGTSMWLTGHDLALASSPFNTFWVPEECHISGKGPSHVVSWTLWSVVE